MEELIKELRTQADLFNQEADTKTQMIKDTERALLETGIGLSFEIQIPGQAGDTALLRTEKIDSKTLRIKLSDACHGEPVNLIGTSIETRLYYARFMPDLIKKAIATLKEIRES